MSSGFISETELAEKRKVRQEEWEKVRQPNQPLEVPEEPYDHRSLYERLEEQKQKKQLEFEETHKFKNMIKGLDDDEVEFLDLVDQKKMEAEQLKELEEKQELLDFRKKVEKLKETTINQRIQAEIQIQPSKSNGVISSGIKSQHQLLKGVVVKKRLSEDAVKKENENNKIQNGPKNEIKIEPKDETKNEFITVCCGKKRKKCEENAEEFPQKFLIPGSGLTCVGILPGLGSYVDSSDDSDHSSSASEEIDDKNVGLAGKNFFCKRKNGDE